MTPDKKVGPILMTGTNVLAILKDRKTHTRRIMEPQPSEDWTPETWGEVHKMRNGEPVVIGWGPSDVWGAEAYKSKYGKPGDHLWVRETYFDARPFKHEPLFKAMELDYIYRADYEYREGEREPSVIADHPWRPSIFMLRNASRITLEIVAVRVERLNDISEEDAIAEGIERINNIGPCRAMGWKDYTGGPGHMSPIESYKSLWESINGLGTWDQNPWVWVIEFKRV